MLSQKSPILLQNYTNNNNEYVFENFKCSITLLAIPGKSEIKHFNEIFAQ